MAAAAGKKKKGKTGGKTLSLNEFLQDEPGPGSSYVLASKPVSWAEEVEQEAEDGPSDNFDMYGVPKPRVDRAVLPTAPRAARGPDVDMDKIPSKPPFTAFLGNLPYDIEEEDIEGFFRGLKVDCVNVRLPQELGRMKGFGYAEFVDRATLIEALTLNDSTLRNRKIRIDLAEQTGDQGRDGGRSSGRPMDDGEDRTLGDWRRKPPSDDRSAPSSFSRGGDEGGSSRYGDRDGGRDRYGGGAPTEGRWGSDRGDSGGGAPTEGRWGSDRGGDRGGDRYDDRDGGRRSFGTGFHGGERRDDRYSSFGSRDSGRDDRYGGGRDDRYGSRDDRYSGGSDRYGGREDRYGGGREDRFGGGRERYEPPSGRDDRQGPPRDSRGGYPDRNGRDFERREPERGGDEPPREGGKERPRLQLQKRTKPIEEAGKVSNKSASIFGGAKPVDTAAKEREIEDRLNRQKEMENEQQEKENRHRLISSSSDGRSRTRKDSSGSQDGGTKRERKLSSSSSGKGIRTVAPPPGAGSARVRRDSALSDSAEDVFSEDGHHPSTLPAKVAAQKSPSSVALGTSPPQNSPPKKEEPPAKLVPAPIPKENIWEKRKIQTAPAPSAPAPKKEEPSKVAEVSVEQAVEEKPAAPPPKTAVVSVNAASSPVENVWNKGKPQSKSSSPPKENVWEKRKQDSPKDKVETTESTSEEGSLSGGHWGKKRGGGIGHGESPPGRGGGDRGRGRDHRGRGGAWGRGEGRGLAPNTERREKREKPLPQTIDEMPKQQASKGKDWSDANKFAGLMDEEEENVSDKES